MLGMRIQNEQSGSTSLFAQPMAVEPIPEEQGARKQGREEQGTEIRDQGIGSSGSEAMEASVSGTGVQAPAPARVSRGLLEARLEALLAELSVSARPPSSTVRQGHLALLKRWYYRPEARRVGEVFFADAENRWPIKAILRGVGRVAAEKLRSDGSPD